MTNYCKDPAVVRVDIFKPSGKWHTTEEVMFLRYRGDILSAFTESLHKAVGSRYSGMVAVCLEPYHENAHPLMVTLD